jgi:hypothetical protein
MRTSLVAFFILTMEMPHEWTSQADSVGLWKRRTAREMSKFPQPLLCFREANPTGMSKPADVAVP